MRSAVVAIALAAFATSARAALPRKCTTGANVITSELDFGSLTDSADWQCAVLQASQGSVTTMTFTIPESVLAKYESTPELEVTIWKAGDDPEEQAWSLSSTAGSPDFNSNGIFFIVPPGVSTTNLRDSPDNFRSEPIIPSSAVWGGLTTTGWRIQDAGDGDKLFQVSAFHSTSGCPGTYTFAVNAKEWNGGSWSGGTVKVGVLFRLRSTTASNAITSKISPGGTVSIANNWYSPASSRRSVSVPIDDSVMFAKLKYMIQSASMSVDAMDAGILQAFDADTNSVFTLTLGGGDGGTWSPDSSGEAEYSKDGSTVTLGYTSDYLQYTAATDPNANAVISLSMTTGGNSLLVTNGYKWYEKGPFLDITLKFNSATEFPTLASSQSVSVMRSPDQKKFNKIFMYKSSDPLVYEVAVTMESVKGSGNGTELSLPPSSIAVTSFAADPTSDQSRSDFSGNGIRAGAGIFASDYSPSAKPNSGRISFGSLPRPLANAALARPYVYFFQFTHAACSPGGGIVSYTTVSGTAKLQASSAKGECASHRECIAPEGAHPSQSRASLSANGDVSRFSSCYAIFDAPSRGVSVPVTRCMECAPVPRTNGALNDLECNEGQFCVGDYGICNSGSTSNAYKCDTEVNSWVGICRNKTTQALGQRCRTITTGTVTSNPNAVANPAISTLSGSPPSTTAAGATFQSLLADRGFAAGDGFCGEVRYFNATSNAVVATNEFNSYNMEGVVRSVLWQGACVAGQCMECVPQAFPTGGAGPSSSKSCINGRLLFPVYVDGTVRTLPLNSAASATVVLCFIALFLIAVTACGMQNASNRHRELFGEGPMGCFDVVKATLYEWMCCLKGSSDRIRFAPYNPAVGSTATRNPLPATDEGHARTASVSGTATAAKW